MKFSTRNGFPYLFILFVLSGVIVSCARESVYVASSPPVHEKILAYLESEAQSGLSGVVAIKTVNRGTDYYAFGYSDRDKEILNNKNTVFGIGSLTKQFTGAAILKLEEQGLISLTDSISSYIDGLPKNKEGITINQLLAHTSGLPEYVGTIFEKYSKAEFLQRIITVEPECLPGEKFLFSHAGYSLLGVIIEQVSGYSYEEYLRKVFFDPFEMESTGYIIPTWDYNNVASSYNKCRNWGKPMDLNWGPDGPFWSLKANGGLLSNAEDLMTWQSAIENKKILAPVQMEKFIQKNDLGGANSYSNGWFVSRSKRGTDVYLHRPGNEMYMTDWINYPKEGVSILVMSNDWNPGYQTITSEIAMIMFYPDHEPNFHIQSVECFEAFPDNIIGRLGEGFVNLLSSKDTSLIRSFSDSAFGDYILDKYSSEHIYGVLSGIQSDCVEMTVKRLTVINSNEMQIFGVRKLDDQRIYINLQFDKNDGYRIRKMRYNSN